jgi:N-hydroxyarylamine O-acetyltransferase
MTSKSTSLSLSNYLTRIGFEGEPRADLETLSRIHRLHLEAIAYENLDVQLGRTVGFDLNEIYRKLVLSRRGGWCYEMNGLMAWALEEVGFNVTRLAGAVVRDKAGDESIGAHLALCIQLDAPYLVDVGFGDGLIEPIPIEVGSVRQDELEFRLERVDGSWWRFHNQPHGGAPTFDFQLTEASPEQLARRCEWLQSAPESPFVQNAVCQRYRKGELAALRGRSIKIVRGRDVEKRTIDSIQEYGSVLGDVFGIELPDDDLQRLWHKVVARHEVWAREQTNA